MCAVGCSAWFFSASDASQNKLQHSQIQYKEQKQVVSKQMDSLKERATNAVNMGLAATFPSREQEDWGSWWKWATIYYTIYSARYRYTTNNKAPNTPTSFTNHAVVPALWASITQWQTVTSPVPYHISSTSLELLPKEMLMLRWISNLEHTFQLVLLLFYKNKRCGTSLVHCCHGSRTEVEFISVKLNRSDDILAFLSQNERKDI